MVDSILLHMLCCRILHTGVSEFQDIQLVESGPFGKVLILDGKLQSAEADEYVYHESIIHPALLYHSKYIIFLFLQIFSYIKRPLTVIAGSAHWCNLLIECED